MLRGGRGEIPAHSVTIPRTTNQFWKSKSFEFREAAAPRRTVYRVKAASVTVTLDRRRPAGAGRRGSGTHVGEWRTKKLDLDDPLEMLHELISEGNLLKA